MFSRLSLILILSGVVLAAGAKTTTAQPKVKFVKPSKPDEKAKDKPEWKASAQVGIVMTSGNSQTETFTGQLTASRKQKKQKLEFDAGGTYARSTLITATDLNGNGVIDNEGEILSEAQTTAQNWYSKLRYDYFFTKNNSFWGAAKLAADIPAGKDLFGGAQLGYSRLLLNNKTHELKGEFGYDYTFEDYTASGADTLSIHSGRLFFGLTSKLSEDTAIKASTEFFANFLELDAPIGKIGAFRDFRFNGNLEMTTKLYKRISFNFGFEVRFDNRPAPRAAFAIPYAADFLPLADKVDTVTKATLIVSFL